jgi:hypothetical protein
VVANFFPISDGGYCVKWIAKSDSPLALLEHWMTIGNVLFLSGKAFSMLFAWRY